MYPSAKDRAYFFKLLAKYNAGKANTAETEFVERYLEILEYRKSDALKDFEQEKEQIGVEIKNQLLSQIRGEAAYIEQPPAIRPIRYLRRREWWAAASVLLLLIAGGYIWFRYTHAPPAAITLGITPDIGPGHSGAILTLADGSEVMLDSMSNGIVATQGNMQVQLDNGQLSYNKTRAKGGLIAYNTMSTPRGREYQLVLPDGTKVWLNAASSITYPTSFTGKERNVKINGEAYFEVAANEQQPFTVSAGNTTVLVLGTHFNINAYKDEASINTTLLQGAVKVMKGRAAQVLRPGQQARVTAQADQIQLIANANTSEAIAWKEGAFAFTDADLHSVMRQLARWYDIDVTYEGNIPEATFSGEIDRSLTLSQVLKGLSRTSIHYRITEDGKQLIILP